MGKWLVTFVHIDDISMLHPEWKESRFTKFLEGESQTQAILNFHRERGMLFKQDIKGLLPIVWEIEKL